MNKLLWAVVVFAVSQGVFASNLDDERHTLIQQVRSLTGRPDEFDQHHAQTLNAVPVQILRRYIEGGWFTDCLDDGPGLWNLAQGSYSSFFPTDDRSLKRDTGGYLYHHFNACIQANALNNLSFFSRPMPFLPPALTQNTCVTVLNLNGKNPLMLPDAIGNMQGLQELYLRNTEICDLPATVGGLTRLRKLDIAGCLLVYLPASFMNLVNLAELSLDQSTIFANLELLLGLQQEQTRLGKNKFVVRSEQFTYVNLTTLNFTLTDHVTIPPEILAERAWRQNLRARIIAL